MADAMRALLDELMGKDRNLPNEMKKSQGVRYDDPTVCKYQLVGLCPNRLFKNTRSDLGACPYEIHEDHIDWEKIKEDFAKEGGRDHERLERKLLTYMEELIKEMDRKIMKAKERAEKESAPRVPRAEEQLRLEELLARAKDALERSQKAGEEGDVDASMSLAQQAEEAKQQHEKMLKNATAPERTMMVCDICGVFINSTDNEQRRLVSGQPSVFVGNMDHLMGKQYLGWKAIREKFAELTAKYDGSQAPPPSTRTSDRDRDAGPRGSSRDARDGRGGEPRRPADDRRDSRRYDDRDSRRYDSRSHERERSPRRDERRDRDRESGVRDRDYGRDYYGGGAGMAPPSRGPQQGGGGSRGPYERERPRDDYERRR